MTSADSRQPQCPEEKGARGPVDLCFAQTGARIGDKEWAYKDCDVSEVKVMK